MLSEIFHWLVSLAEVLAVIATILLAGLILALAAFWVLTRIAGALAGVDPDSDPLGNEIDGDKVYGHDEADGYIEADVPRGRGISELVPRDPKPCPGRRVPSDSE